MFGYSAGEHSSGYSIVGAGDQGYQDIPSPPPPPPQISTASDWSNPYVGQPPLVAVPASSEPSMWDTWFKRGSQVTTGLVNIFGQAVAPSGQPVYQPPPATGIPLLGWVAIGVGGVVVLGIAARALRPARKYAGYKRRKR
jgi:hypothetical protein